MDTTPPRDDSPPGPSESETPTDAPRDEAPDAEAAASDPRIRARKAAQEATPHGASVALRFDDDNLPVRLAEASREDMDAAAFGIIELDDAGIIEFYNAFEQQLSGITFEEARGRSFFEDVAPCTQSKRFSGKFFEGVEAGIFDHMFTYTFTYRMKPLIVKIRICRNASSQNFVLVDPMR
jgi:photoactive yellow protein